MNTVELIQWGKRLIKDPLLTETDLTIEPNSSLPRQFWIDALDRSVEYFENLMLQQSQDYFVGEEVITYVAGTQTYKIAGNSIQLRLLERVGTDRNYNLHPITIVEKNRYDNKNTNYGNRYIDTEPTVYSFWGNRLRIADSNESGTMNHFFVRRLPKIMLGTVTSAAATTITLPAAPTLGRAPDDRDDYYNGATLRIISATAGAGQRAEITDYVGSTRVCTIAAPTVALTGTIVAEIVCEIPENHHEAVAARMAVLAKLSDTQEVPASIDSHSAKLETNLINASSPRHSDEPRSINAPYGYGYLG